MSEVEVRQFIGKLAQNNKQLVCFAGAGIYDHYTPSAIPSLIARSEFLTSYTPYQAEISQGTLHYIFEYQSMMSELTGMEISNASMYDGTTATAEAVLMANASSKKSNRVLVSETLDPKTRSVVDTYAHYHGVELVTIPAQDGVTSRQALASLVDEAPVRRGRWSCQRCVPASCASSSLYSTCSLPRGLRRSLEYRVTVRRLQQCQRPILLGS